MSELVSKELVKEIVEAIQNSDWSCQEEIECYMHSKINNTDEYDLDDWIYGKGKKWRQTMIKRG